MNLSAKGGEPLNNQNMGKANYLGSITATTVNRHPSGIANPGTRFGVEAGIDPAAWLIRTPGRSRKGETVSTF